MHAVAPEFFTWIDETLPIINVVAIMALVLAIIGIISSFMPSSSGERKTFEVKLRQMNIKKQPQKREYEPLGREVRFIKRWIRPIAKKAVKGSSGIVEDLKSVGKAIKRYGHIPRARQVIIEQIRKILPKEHELQNRIMQLKDLNSKLLKFDSSLFSEKSGMRFDTMSPEEKSWYAKEIKDEIERIGLEKQVQQMEQKLEQCIMETNRYLAFAGEALNEGKPDESLKAIEGAVASERQISELAQRVKKFEGILLSMAKRDLKIEKH